MEEEEKKGLNDITEKDQSRAEEVKKHFDNELKHIEKRLGDIQKYPTYIVAALTAIIILIGLFSAFNLHSERAQLRELAVQTKESINNSLEEVENRIEANRKELTDEIRASFEKGRRLPDVILLSEIDEALEGKTLTASILPATEKGQKFRVEAVIILKNQGKGASDPLFIKIYGTDDLPFGGKSSDERDFAYESVFPPEKFPFETGILPAGVSTAVKVGFNVRDCNKNMEEFPMLMKVYFGGDSPNQSRFFLKIPEQEE